MSQGNPYRETELRRAALEALDLASPYALPEESLRVAVNSRMRPPAGEEEFGETLQALSTRKAVATVEDSLDEGMVKWTITEVGKAILAQLPG
jgi:hypothetical protein